jgi:ABC-type bacteriocin/lantibiotic exporter with double-glycine peptidase domain
MNRVQQVSIEKADCGVACVAMVTESKYSEALAVLAHHEINGKYYTQHKELMTAITKLEYSAKQKKFKGFRNIVGRAIVATNKRKDGCWHWVVFNRDSLESEAFIYDPKPNKKDKITDFRGLKGVGNYIQVSVIGDM